MARFESDVNENGGCWLHFDKMPPVEEEDHKKAAGAKGAPKGKGQTEELKPVHGKVWINLENLMNPDVSVIENQRFLLQTVFKQQEGSETQD